MTEVNFWEMVAKTTLQLERMRQEFPEIFEKGFMNYSEREAIAFHLWLGYALTTDQRIWLIKNLNKGKFPPGKPGPKPRPVFEMLIVYLVSQRLEDGMIATRNDATSDETTACDCIAEALSDLDETHASYDQVKNCWEKRPSSVHRKNS